MARVLAERPAVGFFEVHPENYIRDKAECAKLAALRHDYPLSFHGVGLSLGSANGVDEKHLKHLRGLVSDLDPFLISDHLSWSVADGIYLNDLLPMPYTAEALKLVVANITHVQDVLGRRILIENPSAYLSYEQSEFGEVEFLRALVKQTGCGILLDVNNVFVSANNLGFDASAYLRGIPYEAIGEIHLAGHSRNEIDGSTVLIDDHGAPVAEPVWQLYAQVIARAPQAVTLIEWDSNIPALDVLLKERDKAARRAERTATCPLQNDLDAQQKEMARALIATHKGDCAVPLNGHFSVYRNNVRQSLREALASVYSAVEKLVGEEFFGHLAMRFLEINPPRTPYVADYGAELGDFIAAMPACDNLPYLADVARLEWAASRIGLDEHCAPLTPARLSEFAQAHPDDLGFETQPGLFYLATQHPVDEIFSFARMNGEGKAPVLDGEAVFLEVAPGGEGVTLRRLDAPVFRFREHLCAGAPLRDAADTAVAIDPLFDLAAALRFALLDGIFTDCRVAQSVPEETKSCLC